MLRALLLITRWIGLAHDRWKVQIARRRPLAAEVDFLHERMEKLRAENDLLRARLKRLPARRRPRYRPVERLDILWVWAQGSFGDFGRLEMNRKLPK